MAQSGGIDCIRKIGDKLLDLDRRDHLGSPDLSPAQLAVALFVRWGIKAACAKTWLQ
jgi:hypothetical protein